MFQKEKDGVYLFGSKKVTMKVENNMLMARTGGGYLTIEQFVHQYLNLELEKADRIQQMEQQREEAFGQVLQQEKSIPKKMARKGSKDRNDF